MIQETEIVVSPTPLLAQEFLCKHTAKKLSLKVGDIRHVELLKKSIDARSKQPKFRLRVRVYTHQDQYIPKDITYRFPQVGNEKKVLICGAGPSGLFAALTLILQGIKPIILERGKQVHERKKDIALLQTKQVVNPNSNYCFGEGGAGTFSDGKLYTRSSKRGDVSEILKILVFHGAEPSILTDAHPHIGSDALPRIIKNIRETILNSGGEFYFNTLIEKIIVENNKAVGLTDSLGNHYQGDAVFLCNGHSGKEIYQWFYESDYMLEPKPFAMGVRLEHPQALIDQIQYHTPFRPSNLPAAEYRVLTQIEGRGVFSFCMCPGGRIIPSSTKDGYFLVNGMSNSERNSPFANAGLVVTVSEEDFAPYKSFGGLAGLKFQEEVEATFSKAANYSQQAPAQRMTDFVQGKLSDSFPPTSYHPSLISARVDLLLPSFVAKALQKAFLFFDSQKKGFLSPEALVIGLESRTSSAVRIPRDKENLQHPQIQFLYPCGEGAGYAGGIVSSALDGVACANQLCTYLKGV